MYTGIQHTRKEDHVERNTELLEKTMQYIMDHPQQHDQTWWVFKNECGTAACFAGWACLLDERVEQHPQALDLFRFKGDRDWDVVGFVAEKALGLTKAEGARLFHAINTREVLQLMVKDLVNGDEMPTRDHYWKELLNDQSV